MTDELTPERLREWGYQLELEGNPLGSGLQKYANAWAADRRRIKEAEDAADFEGRNATLLHNRAERAEAKRDRLREAAERVVSHEHPDGGYLVLTAELDALREALAATEEKRDD